MPDGFYTLKGYQICEAVPLTSAMEDYLEMICRLTAEDAPVRVGELSARLHVRPSSVTKMVRRLLAEGYLAAERYGAICLTEKGRAAGEYLLRRHEVIRRFLCLLNGPADTLEEAEKIEHFLSRQTVEHLEALLPRLAAE